ncbi:NBR1-Ig-like domain-containing protein [Allokutzneria sp. A3M-2-11 16]|uniref:NBR1-Ig-like domain-containing protein n=1 Tax=Allokutzneria sp. A3M-2-11 16 TaxID=2962043 RepID=UPI0020B82189|nr:NBR1-Ig-like domain-containing protein [Allokutzneria sp. A3M-2-11 16]MCP3802579.1 NBR1-Ig-like domain-containing protein [Allokutzneria sp. A3M-2-11 16]
MRPDPASGPVAEFADELWRLKLRAGNPSYDCMRAVYGAAASKSSLAAAARGQHFPSRETTWEYVRALAVNALGEDVDEVRTEWCAKWERARAKIEGGPLVVPLQRSAPKPVKPIRLFGSGVVLLAIFLLLGLFLTSAEQVPLVATGVPEHLHRLVPGDNVGMRRMVNYPNGAIVHPGTDIVKIWELVNVGSATWTDRYLVRIDPMQPGGCSSPERVPIAMTRPGQSVLVAAPFHIPDRLGQCVVRWKMAAADGTLFFPESLYVQLHVIIS